jgi:predicted methyltransferase
MKRHLLHAAAALCVLAAPLTLSAQTTADYAQALADPARPSADKERDAARKPSELLAFAGVKPGQAVLDYGMGGGYWTRILAKAVGPSGRVYSYQPGEFIKYQASYGTNLDTVAAAYPNVTPLKHDFAALQLPEQVDAVISVQIHHDHHLKGFAPDTAAKANAALFRAVKPGGVLVVVDHRALPGAGLGVAQTLHRIDIEDLKKDVTAAGFVLDGESALLANPEDPKTALVFGSAIRGKTDQFVLRFRKPKT